MKLWLQIKRTERSSSCLIIIFVTFYMPRHSTTSTVNELSPSSCSDSISVFLKTSNYKNLRNIIHRNQTEELQKFKKHHSDISFQKQSLRTFLNRGITKGVTTANLGFDRNWVDMNRLQRHSCDLQKCSITNGGTSPINSSYAASKASDQNLGNRPPAPWAYRFHKWRTALSRSSTS